MKVLLLSGSPKSNGNTAQVLEKCARSIEAQGVDTEIVSLAGKKIEACIACGFCAENGKCGRKDDLDPIIEKLRTAQGFVVGSPVYFGTARGDVMNALQRIGMVSMRSDKFLAGMVGGPIAVARRGGHTLTLQEMLMFYLINDMIVPGSCYWNMVFGREPGEALSDEEGIRTVSHFGENVARLVKTLSASRAPD
jgi:multimeric flavodoxin WrbA